MSKSAKVYLHNIIDEVDFLVSAFDEKSLDDLLSSGMLQRASARSFEIIGEAAKRITDDFKEKYAEVPWRQMAGMRNQLIHGYDGIDYGIVFDTVKHNLPELKKQMERVLAIEEAREHNQGR